MTTPALSASLNTLQGVGPKLQAKLGELGLHVVQDVLFHFPLRYEDRTQVTPIAALQEGMDAVVTGEIRMSSVVTGRRRSLIVKVEDATGILTLRFFHFRHSQAQQMTAGTQISLFGQARRTGTGVDMVHPEYRLGSSDQLLENQLTPVYPTVTGIGQLVWRKLSQQALTLLERDPPADLLGELLVSPYTLAQAIQFLHRPPPGAALATIRQWQHPAQHRLAIEELLAHQLSLKLLRARERAHAAPALATKGVLQQKLRACLPFALTDAQDRVIEEILTDLHRSQPMLRLVQGDVGSGKTLVAAMAALTAIEAGYQVALMAPTELLADQHQRSFQAWFEPLDIPLIALTGKSKGKERQAILQTIANGTAALVVGTHALFQEQVHFQKLGLVIVDEQHRFGVHQRLTLTEKSQPQQLPHQLVLTATPIPRTLSMVAYADLDCSVIDSLPPGRQPVTTTLVDNNRRDEVIARVGAACDDGRQAYWVCTLVEESEVLHASAAEATAEQLTQALPNTRIGLLHGRLSAAEKTRIMDAFKAGDIDLLVATTVIEVGVDVPNASLMIIENPERLGLAQLHQLRGRVGRGSTQSFCLLLYQSPLSTNGRDRLQVMRESNDGFVIAEEDLRLRGPGELLGTRQAGLAAFRVAQLPEHEDLLDQVQTLAQALEGNDTVADALVDRWTRDRQAFGRV